MLDLKRYGTAALVVALVALVGIRTCQLRSAQAAGAAAALRADSTAAAADSSRRLSAVALAALVRQFGDSMAAVERRVVQQQQRADGLDRALRRERIARLEADIRIRALDSTVASLAEVREDSGSRVADFSIRQAPYSVTASAVLPPPPRPGSLRLSVALDSVPVQLRLGCGSPDAAGIRPASAVLLGPPWATLALGSVEQSADLCRSPALRPRGPRRSTWIGVGVALTIAARWAWATFGPGH